MKVSFVLLEEFALDVDSKRPDAYLKCLGAEAFRTKNFNDAASFWTQAYQQESSDAEALIYRENARIAQLKLPHVTFIIGTILTGNDAAIGRSVLQGAYAKQEEYNRDPVHSILIRLLIANFSSAVRENLVNGPDIESMVADQIVAATAKDSTIKGLLMSIPFISPTTINKLQTIPVVLSAGFSQQQFQEQTNIFPIAPSAEREGQAAATYVQNKFHHVAVFMDQNLNDIRSISLATSFSSHLAPGTIVATESYTLGDPSTIQAGVDHLLNKHPDVDLIYFAGRSIDVDYLLLKLRQNNAIPVIGGADLYDLGGYSSNNYRRLYFTSFAFADEWEINTHQHHPFTALYRQLFAGWPPDKTYGYRRASSDVLLAYDGTSILVGGAELAGINTPFSLAKFITSLNSIAGTNAFQGFSGRISFGPDRFNKAVVMLFVDNTGFTHEEELDGCLLVSPCNAV